LNFSVCQKENITSYLAAYYFYTIGLPFWAR
jgi:hypothetical protein